MRHRRTDRRGAAAPGSWHLRSGRAAVRHPDCWLMPTVVQHLGSVAAAGSSADLMCPDASAEGSCAVDQHDVTERLWRVADLSSGVDVVLLAEQAQVVAQTEQPLEEPLRLLG